MIQVFDENGLATESGEIRCFYYTADTGEYMGWSDEFINVGVSLPGNSTTLDPGDCAVGQVSVFVNGAWSRQEDNRGTLVYSTLDGGELTVDYIGKIKDGFVAVAPATQFDSWNGSAWVTDEVAQHAARVLATENKRQSLITAAHQSVSLLQLKLQAGRKLSDAETARLNETLDYIEDLEAVDDENPVWPEKTE
ncbi:tail fiber assembly protein [Citrobacter sp. CRE-46]|uniref:tail fiber assembly protein n=1 Tax=Citrobacter sp. CRE-46 TaxID=1703250 RepID=UPI000D7BAA18|nr:tail fiber assembly protein [Citrobacter sp. CRE-46]AWS97499.1 phage tail protein [Citrobacter sp. CRE-46]AWS97552.1 phage tail protein [Citrobacter sp. CRE-46]